MSEIAAYGKLGALWCEIMHDSATWPIHGRYQCRTCGRLYAVPWTESRLQAPAARIRHIPSAFLPLVVLLAAAGASPGRAADVVDSTAGASLALARYTAGAGENSPWRAETVEIDASLPKMSQTGRLRAIRRLLPFGKPEYQVLEMAGDQTVKQQVIFRYLSAEVKAAAIPSSSVAVTAANYKFRYKGPVETDQGLVYAFSITPHKKREGLIKGELWIDGETGSVVRLFGSMVKSPSIFIKHVDLNRETDLRDGVARTRVTHLAIDTRLVGRAELTITEQPYTAPDTLTQATIEEQ
uniref:MucB/RseB N-terminal domain-containing protein n=1 Tax=Solibacter usitatus (strain Ellin6076) TaxID=234267 RepID=Q026M5_SOLUE